jgi:putative flippase GtrA
MLDFKKAINLRDYLTKQIKFSFGNLFSIPFGTTLLFLLTQYGHVWYVFSSLLSLGVTTIMNFWVQYFLRVIPLKNATTKESGIA